MTGLASAAGQGGQRGRLKLHEELGNKPLEYDKRTFDH